MALREILVALVQHVSGPHHDGISDIEGLFPESVKLYNRHFADTISVLGHIHDFINHVEKDLFKSESTSGLYQRAFCDGVKQVLSSYNDMFLNLEKLALSDEHFSIITMSCMLMPLTNTVPCIKEAIDEIKTKELIGCQILDVCEKFCHCGNQDAESAFKIIYKTCLNPFFMQTNSWLIHAEFYDPCNEYFIYSITNEDDDHDRDDNFSVTSSASSLNALDYSGSKSSSTYRIALEKLPSFMPYSTANKVLFIGESLIMCQKNPESGVMGNAKTDEILDQCGLNPITILKRMTAFEDGDSLNVDSFDAFITDIFTGVNRYARKLCQEMGDVRGQVVLMRDLYLLGRGELFHEFIQRNRDSLNSDAHKFVLARLLLKSQFEDSFYYVYLTEYSEVLNAVSFSFPPKDLLPEGAKTIDVLNLEVKIRWPLEKIFPPEVTGKFKDLFRFLLKLKTAQVTLSECWTNTNIKDPSPIMWKMMFIRIKLNAVVGNLQNYCFTDVIDHEMQRLLEIVNSSDTYTDIQHAVANFVNNIAEQLFLNLSVDSVESTTNRLIQEMNSDIHQILADVFSSCEEFGQMASVPLSASVAQLSRIEVKFDSAVQGLFKISENYQHNSHLHDLLYRLDFNDFFSIPR